MKEEPQYYRPEIEKKLKTKIHMKAMENEMEVRQWLTDIVEKALKEAS